MATVVDELDRTPGICTVCGLEDDVPAVAPLDLPGGIHTDALDLPFGVVYLGRRCLDEAAVLFGGMRAEEAQSYRDRIVAAERRVHELRIALADEESTRSLTEETSSWA